MITIDMTKAKEIAHEKRRAARSAEFAPLDIKATIPSEAAAAEAARQAIRDKYSAMQAQMDAAQTADELKALLPEAQSQANQGV
jgi:predicted  nucleic acid-binding Zn-ribbon protein